MDPSSSPIRARDTDGPARARAGADPQAGGRTGPTYVMVVGVALTISILLAVYFLRAWF